MQRHFISDLHLCISRPHITAGFLRYLRRYQGRIDELYILGDFFEAWIGDDNMHAINQSVEEALSLCKRAGTKIFIMHGNRDFLLGNDFAERASATLIKESTHIQVDGETVVLLHGDSLCSDDHEYQAFRQMVRQPEWQHAFLAKSIEERVAIAQQVRATSKQAASQKSVEIMDINDSTLQQYQASERSKHVIHGHTHRPQVHEYPWGKRWVLGDWRDESAIILRDINGTLQLCELHYEDAEITPLEPK